MDELLAYLSSFGELSVPLKSRMRTFVGRIEVPKKERILRIGEVCTQLYFVQRGFARGVMVHGEKETTSWFWRERDIMTSAQSFLQQIPSVEHIETVEDCVLLTLSYDQLQLLYNEFTEFNLIGRKITEHYLLTMGDVSYNLKYRSAKEKYQNLIETHPDIFQRSTLKNISTYLGVTKETVSRLRKQLSTN